MPKYYDHDCLPNFFRSLLTTRVVKNSHILTTTYFTFPQKRRWRNLKSFTTKFRIRSKDRKSNYELRPILVLFCNFVALVLGSSCVKGLIITKFVKQIKFEETWGWKESKNFAETIMAKLFQTPFLLIRNSAQWEKYNVYFSEFFTSIDKIFILRGRLDTRL